MDGIKAVLDIFDIPYDAADGVARVTVCGEREAYVENFISLEDYKKEYVKDIPKYRKLIKDCMRAWICNKKDKVAEILGILKKCEKDMDAETQLEYWELQASLKEQS